MDWDLTEALEYYRRQGAPRDQHALVALLKEIQQEQGSISHSHVNTVADCYGVKPALILAIVRRQPRLRLSGLHTLELCAGRNCGRHTGLADLARKLEAGSGGKLRLTFVPCMRLCAKGPNIRFDGVIYHAATEELLHRLVREI